MSARDQQANDQHRVSRRGFMRAAGVVGTAAVVGTAPSAVGSSETTDLLPERDQAMVLEVARLGAVVPAEFPDFGEPGPAVDRATSSRLAKRLASLSPERLQSVRDGTSLLLSDGLLSVGNDRLLAGIGKQVMARPEAVPQPLLAVVSLAAATICHQLDPHSDGPAKLWLNLVVDRCSPATTHDSAVTTIGKACIPGQGTR